MFIRYNKKNTDMKKEYIKPAIVENLIIESGMLAISTITFGTETTEHYDANRRRDENYDWSDPWN